MLESISALLLFVLFFVMNMHTDETVPRNFKRLSHTRLRTGDILITCNYTTYLRFNHVAMYIGEGFALDVVSINKPVVSYTSVHKLKQKNNHVFVRQLHTDVNRAVLRSKLVEFKAKMIPLHFGVNLVNHVFNLHIPGWPGSKPTTKTLNCVSFLLQALQHLGFLVEVPNWYIPTDVVNLLRLDKGQLGRLKSVTF